MIRGTNLQEDSFCSRNTSKHITTNVLHTCSNNIIIHQMPNMNKNKAKILEQQLSGLITRKLGSVVYDMRQVEVDALDVGVLGHDEAEDGSNAAANVDEGVQPLEAGVGFKDLLHSKGGVVGHGQVKDPVEAGVGALVVEGGHAVGTVEGDAAFQHRILEPRKGSEKGGESLPADFAVIVGVDGGGEDGVAGEETEHAVEHDGGVGVGGRQLGGDLGGSELRTLPSLGDDLQQLQFDGGLEGHGEYGGAHQLHGELAGLLLRHREDR
ncbi:hypothetical protein EJ110_NYTH18892 [Nymphaea thermarum]|nr:hypothetical protein EJ110_NYTH18892 [Nymphaea thermarum]